MIDIIYKAKWGHIIGGNMLNREGIYKADFLADLVKKNDYKTFVEVGVKFGYNMKAILGRCEIDEVYLVDHKIYNEAHPTDRYEGTAVFGDNVVRMVMTSKEASKMFDDKSLDIVFIDADHRYKSVKEDIELWLPKIRKGGVISGHDYGSKRWPGVERAVKEKFNDFNLQFDTINYVWWRYI